MMCVFVVFSCTDYIYIKIIRIIITKMNNKHFILKHMDMSDFQIFYRLKFFFRV